MAAVKRTPKTLQPQRRTYRVPRADPQWLIRVLAKVNGTVWQTERYEPERSGIREIFDRIIEYCDHIEDALAGIYRFTDAHGQQQVERLRTRSDRIARAVDLAGGLYDVFGSIQREFTVFVKPLRNLKNVRAKSLREPILSSFSPLIRETMGGLADSGKLDGKTNVLPNAEQMFRITDLFIWPKGNICVQLCWEFYQGIIQLDDLRRLRKCSGYLHDEPYYFLRKKIERQEHSFCSDQCRSDYNYKKLTEGKNQHGRVGKRKTKT